MIPEHIAKHFALVEALMDEHDIRDPTRIFSLNESGVSIRGMTMERGKCVVNRGTRGNTWEAKFRGTGDHMTFMQVSLTISENYDATCGTACLEKRQSTASGREVSSRPFPIFFLVLTFCI